MWVVGDTDMKALSLAGMTANVSFALGSFFVGLATNILVGYGGSEKLTDVGTFMLHGLTPILVILAIAFFGVGGLLNYKKNSLWNQIKSESKQISQ